MARILACICLLVAAAPAHGWTAPGRIAWPAGGPTFGERQPFTAAVEQPDGTSVIATFRAGAPLVLHRLTADGGEDVTFGDGGEAVLASPPGVEGGPITLLRQSSGRLLVVLRSELDRFRLLVFAARPDGTPDPTFGDGGGTASRVHFGDAALGPADELVLTGTAGGRWSVERLTPDGAPDPSFGGDGLVTVPGGGGRDSSGDRVATLPDGRIVALGVTGRATTTVARLLADGRSDPAFHGGRPLVPHVRYGFALAVLPDASTIVAGTDAVARITPAGELDPGFGARGLVETGQADGGQFWRLALAGDRAYAYRQSGFPGFGSSPDLRLRAIGRRGLGPIERAEFPRRSFGVDQLVPRENGGWLAVGSTSVKRFSGGGDAGLEVRSAFQSAVTALTSRLTTDRAFGDTPSPLSARAIDIRLVRRPRYGPRFVVRFAMSVPGGFGLRLRTADGTMVAGYVLPGFLPGTQSETVRLDDRAARLVRRGDRLRAEVIVRDVLGRVLRHRTSLRVR